MAVPRAARTGTNGLAIVSLISGIVSWFLALVLLCLNLGVLPIISLATFGVGGVLYLCTAIAGCLVPIGWIVGVVTGYTARNQIRQTNEAGLGMANAGYVMSIVGLALTILVVCIVAILAIAGTIQLPNWSSY